jgi:predicted RND superfamily exporter protein
MQFISNYLQRLMRSLGHSVARHPKTHIAVSTLVSLLLTTGLLQVREERNVDKLYFDYTSQSAVAWRFMEEHFPVNYSMYQPDR